MSIPDFTSLFSPEFAALIHRDFKHNWEVMQQQLKEATYLRKTYVTMTQAAAADNLPFTETRKRHVIAALNQALAHHGLEESSIPVNVTGDVVLPLVMWRTFLKGALTPKPGRRVERQASRLLIDKVV